MKTLVTLLAIVLALGTVGAEDIPGYRHEATFREERRSPETPESATIFVRVLDERAIARSLAIKYDIKTRRVQAAWWMTKGMFKIHLPRVGVLVPERLEKGVGMVLILSNEKISDIRTQKTILAGIESAKRQSDTEQDEDSNRDEAPSE